MAEEKTQVLLFEHELGSTKSNDEKTDRAELKEYFIPYTVETLKNNELLSDEEERLFADYSESDKTPLLENGIMDKCDPSEVWINALGEYQETSLFDYVSDATFGTESVKNLSDDTHRVRVGILTELVKILFLQFKVDFSILYRMLSNKKLESSDNETIVKVLHGIAQRSLDEEKKKDFTSRHIREQIETGKEQVAINNLISAIHETAKARLKYVYNLDTTDDILEIVIKAVNNASRYVRKKYEDDKGCFCVVVNDGKKYFAFSGDDSGEHKKSKINKALEKLEVGLKNANMLGVNAERCYITDKTLSYGIRTEHDFLPFPRPLSYKKYMARFSYFDECNYRDKFYSKCCLLSIVTDYTGDLYSCCERKIFSFIKNQKPMEVHCRWAPCEKCAPAVYEEIRKHSDFKFVALAKDFPDFEKKLKKNIRKTISWRLEKLSS